MPLDSVALTEVGESTFSETPVDFFAWANCERLHLREAIALLMGKDPESESYTPDEQQRHKNLYRILERSRLLLDSDGMVFPGTLIQWAQAKELCISRDFAEAVHQVVGAQLNERQVNYEYLEAQHKQALTRINELAKQLADKERALESLREERDVLLRDLDEVWEGFDPTREDYPENLDLALQAHRYVSKNPGNGTVSQQLKRWVQEHSPKKLSASMLESIVRVTNWDRAGGRRRKTL